jgi:molybdate transport system ATP-binding protein
VNIEVSLVKELSGFRLQADFSLAAGRCGLFGPSGSGKSTLMHLLAGLLTPDSGRITLDSRTLFDSARGIDLPARERRIGLVFQHAHLFPHLNVRRNIHYGWKRTRPAERWVDPDVLIGALDIGHLLQRKVDNLSGGERQRVALARAVMACPRLILMDEPLTGLDEQLKYQIIPYLKRMFTEFKIPFLYISHSLEEMRLLTEKVLIAANGRIGEGMSTVELLQKLQAPTGRSCTIHSLPARSAPRAGLMALQEASLPSIEVPAPRCS